MPKPNDSCNMHTGNCEFQITFSNETMLKALTKYAMMLDYVTQAIDDEQLNVEGLINCILFDGMSKRIKDLTKKHGFESVDEFITSMMACNDGEEVSIVIKNQEKSSYQKAHDEILSHIPIEDKQKQLDL